MIKVTKLIIDGEAVTVITQKDIYNLVQNSR